MDERTRLLRRLRAQPAPPGVNVDTEGFGYLVLFRNDRRVQAAECLRAAPHLGLVIEVLNDHQDYRAAGNDFTLFAEYGRGNPGAHALMKPTSWWVGQEVGSSGFSVEDLVKFRHHLDAPVGLRLSLEPKRVELPVRERVQTPTTPVVASTTAVAADADDLVTAEVAATPDLTDAPYYRRAGFCWLNGWRLSRRSNVQLDLGENPPYAAVREWWARDVANVGTDFSVVHYTLPGPGVVVLHIDQRSSQDRRFKVRGAEFIADLDRYVRVAGLSRENLPHPPWLLIGGKPHYTVPWGRVLDAKATRALGKMVLKPVLPRECSSCGQKGQYNVSKSCGIPVIVNYKDKLYCRRCRKAEVEFEDFQEYYCSRKQCGYMYCEDEHGPGDCCYMKVDPTFNYFTSVGFPALPSSHREACGQRVDVPDEVLVPDVDETPLSLAQVPGLVFGETSSSEESDDEAVMAIKSQRFPHPIRLGDIGGVRFKFPAITVTCDLDDRDLIPVKGQEGAPKATLKKVTRSLRAGRRTEAAPKRPIESAIGPRGEWGVGLVEKSLGSLSFPERKRQQRCGPSWPLRPKMFGPTVEDWHAHKRRLRGEQQRARPLFITVPRVKRKAPFTCVADVEAWVDMWQKSVPGEFRWSDFKALAHYSRQMFKCPKSSGYIVRWRGKNFVEVISDPIGYGIAWVTPFSRVICHNADAHKEMGVRSGSDMIERMPQCSDPWCNLMKTNHVRVLRRAFNMLEHLTKQEPLTAATPFQVCAPSFVDRMMGRKFVFFINNVKVWSFSHKFTFQDPESGNVWTTGAKAIWGLEKPMYLSWSGLKHLLQDRGVMAGKWWAPYDLICAYIPGGAKTIAQALQKDYPKGAPDFVNQDSVSMVDRDAAILKLVMETVTRINLGSDLAKTMSVFREDGGGFLSGEVLIQDETGRVINLDLPRKLDLVDGRPEPNPGPDITVSVQPPTPITPTDVNGQGVTPATMLINAVVATGLADDFLRQYTSTKSSDFSGLARLQETMYMPFAAQPVIYQDTAFMERFTRAIKLTTEWPYQWGLDVIDTVPRFPVDIYRAQLVALAKELHVVNDINSLISLMYSAKALLGCPKNGQLMVFLDEANSTLFTSINSVSEDQAAYFFHGSKPLGHAGPPSTGGGSKRHGRSLSESTSRGVGIRNLFSSSHKRLVSSYHRLEHVLRLDADPSTDDHQVSREGAMDHILGVGRRDTVEEAFFALASNKPRGSMPPTTAFYRQDDPAQTPAYIRDAIKAQPMMHTFPNHVLAHLDTEAWVPKDRFMVADGAWHILTAVVQIVGLQPTVEDCYLLLLSWKMVWGCPKTVDILLWVTPDEDPKFRALVANREDRNGGFYIFFNGELIGHAGKTMDINEPFVLPYTFDDGIIRPVEIPSPLNLSVQSPRHEPSLMDKYFMGEPRHQGQDPVLRRAENQGLHHLPVNFTATLRSESLIPSLPTWYSRVEEVVDHTFVLIEAWARDVGVHEITITANLAWPASSDEWVVNLVTSSNGITAHREGQILRLGVPFNGRALRSLRLLYLYKPSRWVNMINVTNGNADTWEKVRRRRPPRGLVFTNYSSCFYIMHMTAANVWHLPGQLVDESWWRYFILTLTVYGSDEAPFCELPTQYQISPPMWGLQHEAVLAIPKNFKQPVNTTFLNHQGDVVDSLLELNTDNCVELIYKLMPGRLRVEAGLPEEVRYVSYRECMAAVTVCTDDVFLLYKLAKYLPSALTGEEDEDPIAWLSEHHYPPKYIHYFTPARDKGGFAPHIKAMWSDENWDAYYGSQVDHATSLQAYKDALAGVKVNNDSSWFWLIYDIILNVLFFPFCLDVWYFYLRCYWDYVAIGYLWPRFDPHIPSPAVSKSDEVFPANYDKTMYDQLLNIRTFGSEGDNRPLDYIARAVARAGLLVHVTTTVEDNAILNDLEAGNLFKWVPGYSSLLFAGKEGYKAVLQPHTDVYGKGSTYTLAPPSKYVEPTHFVSENAFKELSLFRKIIVYIADTWAQTFKADLHIGNLRGCDLPRGMSSATALVRAKNKNTGKIGWTSGSASKDVIPSEIRLAYEEVPKGDHQEIFPEYDRIYCHGGAGTMQTGLACGVDMVSCDQKLDRIYKRPLVPADYHEPTMLPLYGMLLWHGYVTTLPILLKPIALCAWAWSTRSKWIKSALMSILRLLVITAGLARYGSLIIIIAVSAPPFTVTLAKRWGFQEWAIKTLRVLWYSPLILWVDWRLALFLSTLNSDGWLVYLMQDLRAFSEADFHLVYEPIRDNNFLRFPWGHWALQDVKEGDVYEGRFIKRGERGMGKMFKFTKVERRVAKDARKYPVPLRLHTVLMAVATAKSAPYSAEHNCISMVSALLDSNSLVIAAVFRMITWSVIFALKPTEWVLKVYHKLRGESFYETAMARELGFAAAAEGDVPELEGLDISYEAERVVVFENDVDLPFPDMTAAEIQEYLETIKPPRPVKDPDWDFTTEANRDPDNMNNLLEEIASLMALCEDVADTDMEKEVVREAAIDTLADAMLKGNMSDDAFTKVHRSVSDYKPLLYQQAIQMVTDVLEKFQTLPSVKIFLMWIRGVGENLHQFFSPMLRFLGWVGETIYNLSEFYFVRLQEAVARLIDSYWPEGASKRIKTVWGPTGLFKGAYSSARRELELSIAMSEFKGRNTFPRDYDNLVTELRAAAASHPKAKAFVDEIGGDQHRPVRIGRPVMSKNEADMHGIDSDSYTEIPLYDRLINSLLDAGVEQGTDGVIYAARHQELLDRANERYEPVSMKVLPGELEALAAEVADALYNKYPEAHAKADIVSPESVLRYMQVKGKMPYSAGVPFIGSRKLRTRQHLLESGMMDVIKQKAMDYLKRGEMPVDFYHTFGKSQVVSAHTLMSKSKLRTVTSTGLLHTFIENMFQHALNKRPTWRTTGIGSGMPLNQNMSYLWERMAAKFDTYGGMYIEKDATAFDSGIQQFGFRILEHLKSMGFRDHPSGNGAAFASVMKAKYDAMQDAHLLKITQDPRANVVIGAPQHNVYNFLMSLDLPNLVGIDDIKPEELLPGQILVVRHPNECPPDMSWNGLFTFGDKAAFKTRRHDFGHYVYSHGDFRSLQSDVEQLANYDIRLLARHQLKDQGGATGQTATTSDNTWVDKGVMIATWLVITRVRFPDTQPEEFWDYNEYYNQSDDAMWLTYGIKGLRKQDMYLFQKLAHSLGTDLKLAFTNEISRAEYLSKFVRIPTPTDSEDLRIWKLEKIKSIQATMNLTPQQKEEEIKSVVSRATPRFVVYQNIKAAQMRATALRYYQASPREDRYLIAMFQRAAGHAQLTAFCPSFYDQLAHEYCELVNLLLDKHHIWQRYRVELDTYGRQQVLQINPRWKEQALSPRQLSVLALLRQHPFPSYLKVIKTHMEIKTGDQVAYEKLMRKIGQGVYTAEETFKQITDSFWRFTDNIPDEFSKKFMPTIDFIYPDNPFYTKHEIAAKHALWSLLAEFSEDEIDYPMFQNRVAEGPYSAIADTVRTWQNWQNPVWRQRFYDDGPNTASCQALTLSLLYIAWIFLDRWIYKLKWIGPFYSFFFWTFIGLPKLYGILNTFYWHGTGKSSVLISQLMPRDPYLFQKRIVGLVADLIPEFIALALTPLSFFIREMITFCEITAKIARKQVSIKSPDVKMDGPANPWTSHVLGALEMLETSEHKRIYIDAPTSTGKSTMFPAAILSQRQHHQYDRIYLVFPYEVLRDSWSSPYNLKSQVLKEGVNIANDTQICLMTYGHFANSRVHKVRPERDLVLFDEFHLLTGEIVLSFTTYKGPALLMSATKIAIEPRLGLKAGSIPTCAPPIQRRFETHVEKIPCKKNSKPDVVELWQKMIDSPVRQNLGVPLTRVIVIVPTIDQVKKTILALHNLGVVATEVSRRQRVIPQEGHLVCTQIVDAGINIEGATCLVDMGTCIEIHRGKKVPGHPWTDAARNKQRVGRVGRFTTGYVIQPEWAGSGDPTDSYPATSYFKHKAVAHFYNMDPLGTIHEPVDREVPFLHLNETTLNKTEYASVLCHYLLVMSGADSDTTSRLYNKISRGLHPGEHYKWMHQIMQRKSCLGKPLLSPEVLKTILSTKNLSRIKVETRIGDVIFKDEPILPLQGRWVKASTLQDQVTETIHPDTLGSAKGKGKKGETPVQSLARSIDKVLSTFKVAATSLAQVKHTDQELEASYDTIEALLENVSFLRQKFDPHSL